MTSIVGIGPQIEHFARAQPNKQVGPDSRRALGTLLHGDELPVLVAHAERTAVVAEVEELAPGALRLLPGSVLFICRLHAWTAIRCFTAIIA
jgi:hypothetical protein